MTATSWLTWSDELVMGDAHIDADHREMIARARSFVEALGSAAQTEEVSATLKFLLEFVRGHFAAEEALMTSLDYPQREKHRRAHEALFRELSALMVFARGPEEEAKLPGRVETFLHSYFKNHFHAHDAPVAAFVASRAATR